MSDKMTNVAINAERVRAIYEQMPITLAAPIVVAILAAAVLFQTANPVSLFLWFGSIVVLTVARYVLWAAYRRAAPRHANAPFWGIATSIGSAVAGLAWGIGAALLFPLDPAYRLFLAFVIGGLCAGSVTVNSAHLASVLAFLWPATLPLALRFFLQGSALDFASGAMTVVFAAALSLTAYKFHSFFGKAVKLQVELEDRTREVYSTNARLQAEMTEHQATEASLRQAQKTEAVGRLTAGMAHDFNNLLMVISGSVELLQAKLGPQDRYARHLTTIAEAADRGAVLTRQLLAFARQQKLKPRPTDLNALVREMAPLLNSIVGNKVRMDFRLAEDLCVAHVDPSQIEHAIMNLVINARDAMDEGGVVTIETMHIAVAEGDREARLAAGEYASISVADTGCGMPQDVLAQAFDPFFTTKEPGKGTGLGLSQVYGIAQQSGGATAIESEIGRGTRVRVYLPKVRDAGERSHTERRSLAADAATLTPAGLRILLIDDDVQSGAMIAAVLREAGHEVIAAKNTASALRLIQTEIPPDLAILDLAMSEGTGELLVRLIRHRFPAIPTVFVTGDSGAGAAEDEKWLLQKPVQSDALLDVVAQAARERDHLSGSLERV